jgi:hypothetical protein
MKVFTVEFTFFSGLYWSNVDCTITETSYEKLKEVVFTELEYMSDSKTKEEKWMDIEKHVIETELKFPIVVVRPWSP